MTDYLTLLPVPSDAILKSAAHAWNISDPLVRCAVSSLESPSAVACIKLLYPKIEFSFGKIPDPDPRVPFAHVDIVSWEYDGFVASTGLPFPNEEFRQAVSDQTEGDYSLDTESETARRTAERFDGLTPCDMIGTMAFPLACPNDQWPWNWLFRKQVFTALVLAHAAGDNWRESNHGRHLLDMVHGPVDWITTASLIGLLDISRRLSDHSIANLFLQLACRPMCPIWYMNAYKPIWRLLTHLSFLDSRTSGLVAKMNAAITADEAEDGG